MPYEEIDYTTRDIGSTDRLPYAICLAKQIDRINLSRDIYEEQRQIDRLQAMMASRIDETFKTEMNDTKNQIRAYRKKIARGSKQRIDSGIVDRIIRWENTRRYKILICLIDRSGLMPLREAEIEVE